MKKVTTSPSFVRTDLDCVGGDGGADPASFAEAMLVRDGRIAAIGTLDESEHEVGALAPGLSVDFAVLDVGPRTAEPEALANARVLATAVDRSFEASPFAD